MKLDGYYYYTERGFGPASDDYFAGEAIYPVVFWGDGTVADVGSIGFVKDDPEVGPVEYGTEAEAHEAFRRFLRDPARFDASPNWDVEWGAYRVEGDSLRLQILRPRLGAYPCCTYDVEEYGGHVLSDTSFVLKGRTYYFHPIDEKPPSTNWTHTHPKLQ